MKWVKHVSVDEDFSCLMMNFNPGFCNILLYSLDAFTGEYHVCSVCQISPDQKTDKLEKRILDCIKLYWPTAYFDSKIYYISLKILLENWGLSFFFALAVFVMCEQCILTLSVQQVIFLWLTSYSYKWLPYFNMI